jgi:hypothetical protein
MKFAVDCVDGCYKLIGGRLSSIPERGQRPVGRGVRFRV